MIEIYLIQVKLNNVNEVNT